METVLLVGLGLLAASLVLIVVEALVPSGGVIALVAGACAIAGIVALFRVSNVWGTSGLLTVLVLGPMCFLWAIRMLPSTPLGRSLLGPSPDEIARTIQREQADSRAARAALIGARGAAVTDLRPVGVVEIEGQRYDASAEGPLIDRGVPVRVTAVDSRLLRVRAAN
jgi:membrane-bound serine protease (ClpP class)